MCMQNGCCTCTRVESTGWGVGAERRTRGGEKLPTRTVGWRASGASAERGEEVGRFRVSNYMALSIVAVGGPRK